MEADGLPTPNNVIFGEMQVLLAEKRTAQASLRTGVAAFALPLSVLSAPIATSRYYSMDKVIACVSLPTRCARYLSPPRNEWLAIDQKVRHGAL